MKAGEIAGALQSLGYRQIMVDGQRLLSGRLAWFYMTGSWPAHEIDHANGQRDDDRFSNLREATRSENNRNRRASGRSLIKGAFWVARQQKWRASIKRDGRTVNLGMFDTAEAAGAEYARAADEHYGKFARAA
ncbi:HNH endonuclease [Sphingomonas sp. WKB10]|nr:HNH endonuclease [Sphingomonas sp. WKB10]